MANCIRTRIDITGNKEVLQAIFNAIDKCNDGDKLTVGHRGLSENNWVGNIYEILHLNSKLVTDYAIWYEPRFNKYGHLCFIEESKHSRSNYADYLRQSFSDAISGICYSSED